MTNQERLAKQYIAIGLVLFFVLLSVVWSWKGAIIVALIWCIFGAFYSAIKAVKEGTR